MQAACDILIIGGGIVGTSLAYQFARRRAGRVVLLEKTFLGAGITGNVSAILRNPAEFGLAAPLARTSRAFFEGFSDQIGGQRVFQSTGLITVAREFEFGAFDKGPLPYFAGPAAPQLRQVDSVELLTIDPNARLGEGEYAFFDEAAGTIDVVSALAGIADEARSREAELCEGVEVQRILADKGQVIGVETNEGRYVCDTIIVAAGPWTSGLMLPLRVTCPVLPCRTQVALFRRPPGLGRRVIVYWDRAQGCYFFPNGEWIVAGDLDGAASEQPADPDQYDAAADSDWLPGVRQRLNRRYPAMHQGFGRGGYGALTAVTPDRLPILGACLEVRGLWCAAGFNGDDAILAPASADLLADAIVASDPASPALAPYSLRRFEKRTPIKDAAAKSGKSSSKRQKRPSADPAQP